MTFRCVPCDVHWAPYMATDGKCPECGGGTMRDVINPPSPGAVERHRAALARRAEREAREQRRRDFEEYCVARDQELLAATERQIAALPEVEPRRMA